MGLDMFLKKRIFVGANFEHRKVEGVIDIKVEGKQVPVDIHKVYEILEHTAYWRKANQIHGWFVQNVQDGVDDCDDYNVSYSQLMELKELCQKALETKDATDLPPVSGFFFGSTEIDDDYFDDLKYTVKVLSDLDPNRTYVYHSSW